MLSEASQRPTLLVQLARLGHVAIGEDPISGGHGGGFKMSNDRGAMNIKGLRKNIVCPAR
jgi:hypothetical protein